METYGGWPWDLSRTTVGFDRNSFQCLDMEIKIRYQSVARTEALRRSPDSDVEKVGIFVERSTRLNSTTLFSPRLRDTTLFSGI
jgi:hypothetical protein